MLEWLPGKSKLACCCASVTFICINDLLLTWQWWRYEDAWCRGLGTGVSLSRRGAAWLYQRHRCRLLPQSKRTGWDSTPPEKRISRSCWSPDALPWLWVHCAIFFFVSTSFSLPTLTAEVTSSGSCTSSPSLHVYKQSITFLFSSLPERIISPARFPRKNWAIRAFPPFPARREEKVNSSTHNRTS